MQKSLDHDPDIASKSPRDPGALWETPLTTVMVIDAFDECTPALLWTILALDAE